jgi:hypothetical protein
MLKSEQIVKNAKKFFQTSVEKQIMNDELMTFLGESFIKAPATAMRDQYNAFEGGLIDHLLNVTKYAVIFNNALPESDRVSQDSLIKVCLLHQIGKAHLFTPCTSEWHRTNQGKMYEFNNELIAMRVSERSLYYALNYGVKLTDEEYAAISMFDKTDDKMAEYHNTTLGDLLKTASLFAIKSAKNKLNESNK